MGVTEGHLPLQLSSCFPDWEPEALSQGGQVYKLLSRARRRPRTAQGPSGRTTRPQSATEQPYPQPLEVDIRMRPRCAQPLCREELKSPRTRPEPRHAGAATGSRVGGGARDPEAGAQTPGWSPAVTWSYDGRGHHLGAAPARACGVSGHLARPPFPDRQSSIRPDTRAHGSCPDAQRVKEGSFVQKSNDSGPCDWRLQTNSSWSQRSHKTPFRPCCFG